MASPHPTYPIPGPSSYYSAQPQPPPFTYPNGPGPASYYQYPIPPMNGHAPMHQPTSPRVHSSSRGRYNAYRGTAPSYHHYNPMPPPHSVHVPAAVQSPPVSPVNSYVHPPKYSPHVPPHVPYSPQYAPQPNGVYLPAWSPQPIPSLPKQLSMLPPAGPTSPLQAQPLAHEQPAPVPSYQRHAKSALPVSFMSPQEPLEPSIPDPVQQILLEPQWPQIVDESPLTPQPASQLSPTQSSLHRPSRSVTEPSSWVIWSRRPENPSQAHGIIISPGAYPPEDVVVKALDIPTPPSSPKAEPANLVQHSPVPQVDALPIADDTSADVPEVPSSSATETTPASSTPGETPVPGSPASSHTSVSLALASPVAESTSKEGVIEKAGVQEDTTASAINQDIPTPVVEATPSIPDQQIVQQEPPPPPVVAAPKKSWASLLQSDAAASSSKTRLPISSVVGFSIPATALSGSSAPTASSQGAPVFSPHRNELLNVLTNGPPASSAALKIQPRGLINTGNMCFANAVLQILVYCPPFHRLFTELGKYLTGPVVGSQKEGTKATPLIDASIQFIREFVPESKTDAKAKGKQREDDFYEPESFIPAYVYDAMKEKKRFASMIGGHQEDAEEFLGFFLDTLEEELLSLSSSLTSPKPAAQANANNTEHAAAATQDEGWFEVGRKNRTLVTRTIKSTDSPITRIFGGKFRSTLRAPHQKDSVTVEDWRSLRLDIQRDQVHSIKDALLHISHPQPVQISQPTRPGVVEATQQALIESLPPVLVLHLKRFLYDTNVGDVVKIGKQIAYGPDLEISPDLISPTRRSSHPVKYQLFGVLYHHGQSASGGHYTLDVLHPNRDLSDRPRPAWIRIDDELVSDVRPDDVFGEERDDRCAYLLFYRRLGGWGASRT